MFIVAVGQGVGKKAAKNNAAEKMLHLLDDLPPIEPRKKGMSGLFAADVWILQKAVSC